MLPEWINKMTGAARAMAEQMYRAVMAAGQDSSRADRVTLKAVMTAFEEQAGEWLPRAEMAGVESGQQIRFRASQAADGSGLVWEVVIIAPGISLSYPAFFWSEELLAEAAGIFKGVDVNAYELTADFFQHLPIPDVGLLEDVKRYLTARKVGTIEETWYVPGQGVMGRIRFLPEQAWLPRTIQQGMDSGNSEVLGLSIDSRVKGFEVLVDDYKVLWVSKIISASSVDVVTRPAAGGKFVRALMGLGKNMEDNAMKFKFLQMIKSARPELLAGKDEATMTDDEVIIMAQQCISKPAAAGDEGGAQRAAQAVGLTADQVKEMIANEAKTIEARAACGVMLDNTLAASDLPEPARKRVRATFAGKTFDAANLTAAITEEKDYLATMSASPNFAGLGDQGRASVGLGSMEKIQIAVDRMFGISGDDRAAMGKMVRLDGQPLFSDLRAAQAADETGVPSLSGLQQLYVLTTGDTEISGQFNRRNLSADLRAAQDINSGTFSFALGNTLARRAVKDYNASDFGESLLISVRKPVKDFRTQEAINIGYFGDLADVDPESGDYQEIAAPGDEESTYQIGQKGNILTVTRRTIINDDISLIQRMITRLMRAGRRTHAKYVWSLFKNNANCSDGTAWFTGPHGNLGSTALGFASASAAYVALANMTEKGSGEPIGLLDNAAVKPMLIYPPALMNMAASIVNDEFYYASNDLTTKTRNALQGKIEGRQISLLTDTTDWGLLMPPGEVDMVEMGYLNGRQEPELFLADGPQSEAVFTSDKIRYKIRHEYAGTVVDCVSGYKAVVAGG